MGAALCIRIADRAVTCHCGPRTVRLTLPVDSLCMPVDALAGQIIAAMEEWRPLPGRATLALPTAWYYVQRLIVPQRRPSRTVLAYALEEFLPVEIELLTCDFLSLGQDAYLGVAVETERLHSLLDRLAAAGVAIEHIVLDALTSSRIPADGAPLLWCDHAHLALVRWRAGRIDDLRVVRFANGGLENALVSMAPKETEPTTPPFVSGPAAEGHLPDALRGAKRTEPEIAAPASVPLLDFARDELAPPSWRADVYRAARNAAAALLAALLLLAVGLVMAQGRLADEFERVGAAERALFQTVFPGEPAPRSVGLRLASEHKRWSALAGTQTIGSAVPSDALRTLRDIVAALPSDLCVDVQEIRIESGEVLLRGRTRDHAAAERLAAALDALGTLDCQTPRTDRLESGGVGFFIHARQRVDSKAVPGGLARGGATSAPPEARR